MTEAERFKYIVRIAGKDIDGTLQVVHGLAQIKGVGVALANALCHLLGINPYERVGLLTESQIAKIEEAIRNPGKYGLPAWMMNRRKDYVTGNDIHLVGADLIMAVRADIERLMKIKCWKGIRHSLGLKVRGQRTRTTGRLGMTVGVRRRRR